MALPSSNQPLSRGGPPSISRPITPRATAPTPQKPVSATPKDTSIFGGRQYVSAKEVENRWRGPSRQTGYRIQTQGDRLSTLKKMQDSYGTYIKPGNVDQFLKKLNLEKSGKNAQEQAKIDQDIKWLRGEFKGPGK